MQDQRTEPLNQDPSLKRRTLATILQALADPALTRLKADDLSRTVLQCLREIMGADNLAILLLTEDHTALHIHTVLGVEETVAHDVHIPLGQGFAGKIATQGFPLIVHDGTPLEILTPVLREQLHSLLGVPLIVHKQVIGVLHVGMKRRYSFTDSDIALLTHVADYLAQAFERTLLIEAEQHEFEELVEAQLCAIVELVEAQQRMALELMETQLHAAEGLVEAQQRVALELVREQLRTAEGLVEVQLHAAGELVEVQLPTAEELVKAQLYAAGELVKAQKRVAGELMGAQLHTAEGLVGAQQHAAGELVETQLPTVGELVETQQRIAAELVEVQLHAAGELVGAQLNEQLEQVNKMQSDFISVVSHEFRTSLTVIEGFSDLLRSDDYSGEEVKDYANDIYTDAIRLHRMVTDLLDLEQMKKGKMQLRVVWVDINMLLTTVAKHMELVSTRHALRLSLDEKLPQLEGDPDKLIQVITNVLSNAIKYSPVGGDILIKSRREGKDVHVSVQDHGTGIASEFIENIFTPYHRITSTSTRYIQGTGLGLSLVQEIILLHNGKIWVDSTPGHGSTFHLSLPLIREALNTSAASM